MMVTVATTGTVSTPPAVPFSSWANSLPGYQQLTIVREGTADVVTEGAILQQVYETDNDGGIAVGKDLFLHLPLTWLRVLDGDDRATLVSADGKRYRMTDGSAVRAFGGCRFVLEVRDD